MSSLKKKYSPQMLNEEEGLERQGARWEEIISGKGKNKVSGGYVLPSNHLCFVILEFSAPLM